jgi:acetylornithine deacetylase/succinyl-diaminopimelate desuccinylase-like protein
VSSRTEVHTRASRRAAGVRSDRLLQTMLDAIRVPSHAGEETAIVNWLQTRLAALGMQVSVDRHTNVVARLERGPRRLLIVVHRNIRDPDPGDPAPCLPRVVEHDNDRLIYGLGVASSKAATAALIEALTVLSADPDPGSMPSIIVASHPGTFAVRGGGIAELFEEHDLHAEGAIVSEPTGLQPGVAARGYAHIEIAFERDTATGSSVPEHPITAVAAFLHAIRTDDLPHHPQLGAATVTPIHWWSAGDSQVAIDRAGVLLDRRFLPDEPGPAGFVDDYRRMAAAVSSALPLRVVLQRYQYPFAVAEHAPILVGLGDAIRLCTGTEPVQTVLPFSCGAGTVQRIGGIEPVAFSGNEVAYVGADEHVRLGANVLAARILVAAMTLFAACED